MENMLKGKTAIVTGSSKGIGKAIALDLAKKGANIIVNYINGEDAAIKVVEEIKSIGADAIAVKADVSNKEQVESLFGAAKEKFGKIDILVNNAGITKDRSLKKMTEDEWKTVINVNLNSVFYCSQQAAYQMESGSSIINISSIVGISGNFGQTNYSASKAGIIGFTKSLAKELGGKGIRVNAIAPGFIETEMTDKIPFIKKKIMLTLVPMGRMGKPEEIAQVVSFLASSQATYINGEVIRVDGGMSF